MSSAICQLSVLPPVLPTLSVCWVVVLGACVLARLSGLTSMFGGPPAVTVSATGTITRPVPLPGPGVGSLLVTHRRAVYVPLARPVEFRVTLTGVEVPPVFVPLVGLALSQGTSLRFEQSARPSTMKGRSCAAAAPVSMSEAQPALVYCSALAPGLPVWPRMETGGAQGPEASVPSACQSSQ